MSKELIEDCLNLLRRRTADPYELKAANIIEHLTTKQAEELAQKLLKAIGKESPIVAMNALYLAMQAVDASVFGLRKKK